MRSGSSIFAALAAVLFLASSCNEMPDGSGYVSGEGNTGGAQEEVEHDEDTGLQSSLDSYTSVETGLDVSGLCLNLACDSLIIAGDVGAVYVYDSFQLFNPVLEDREGRDFEAVTLDRESRSLYLATGDSHSLYRLAPPRYDSLILVKPIVIDSEGSGNERIEALAWKDANTLLIGNGSAPHLIAEFSPDSTYVRRIHEVNSVTSISDMCYDPESGYLWVLDGQAMSLVVLDGSFAFVKKYSLSFMQKKDNPEGLALDRVHNKIWAGCDGTGLIYSIDFQFD